MHNILVMGLSAADGWSRTWSDVTVALTLLAFVGNFSIIRSFYRGWRSTNPSAETGYLWASSEQRQEWLVLQRLIDGRKATLLVPICGGELLSPQFERPVAAYLIPAVSAPEEVDRKAQQISEADFVVRPTPLALGSSPDDVLKWWPQLRSAMRPFKLVWAGKYFMVYEKPSAVPRSH